MNLIGEYASVLVYVRASQSFRRLLAPLEMAVSVRWK